MKASSTLEGRKERIGFLDIETEDLSGEYGVIFCWCILDNDSGHIYEDAITLKDISKYKSRHRDKQPKEDKRVIKSLVDRMCQYDRLIGHYQCKFDLPFIRTRAVICGVDFPIYGEIFQSDTWLGLKHKFKLRRNSLENATRNLCGETRKDHLSLAIKHGCLRGEKWAIKDTLVHCRKDVLDTRDLWNKIHMYSRKTNASI